MQAVWQRNIPRLILAIHLKVNKDKLERHAAIHTAAR